MSHPYPDISTLADILKYVNTVSNGYFGLGILVVFWLMMLFAMAYRGFIEALASSSFVSSLVAAILAAIGVLNPMYFALSILISLASVFILWLKG